MQAGDRHLNFHETRDNLGPRPSLNAGDQLHDVDSAADYLRCGRRLIYRLVAERRVKFTYAGRSLRFWQTDLDAYLEARAVDPIHPPLPR